MRERDADSPPPPRGAGAGGGGRNRPGSSLADPRGDIPLPESAGPIEGSIGWGPRFGQTRQRELAKANLRAKRLRKEMTPSEKALWQILRKMPDTHFRKQVAIDHRVFDFGEFGARLLIELDGAVHDEPDVALDDAQKQARAEAAGFRVLRLTNADVAGRPDWVVQQVSACLDAPHPPAPAPRGGGGEGSRQ